METMTRTSDISLKSDGGCKILMSEQELYVRAAQLVVNYTKTHTVQFDVSSEEIQRMRDEFCEKFSPEKLKALEDDKLLSHIFLTSDGSNDSLKPCQTSQPHKEAENFRYKYSWYSHWPKDGNEYCFHTGK